MQNKDAYISKMKLQLDELNAALDVLEARAQIMRVDVSCLFKAEMRGLLRKQSQLVIEKLNELDAANDDSWEQIVAGTEKVRDAFIYSFHNFKSQL